MNLELTRIAYLSTGTLGYLKAGPLTLSTIERPWIAHPDGPGGMQSKSCIPDGTYHVEPWNSARFPDTYILVNNALGVYKQPNLIPPGQTHGRSAILIHVGNYVDDVIGCIAVGLTHAHDKLMVTNSRAAMDKLRAVLGKTWHTLNIRATAGTAEAA